MAEQVTLDVIYTNPGLNPDELPRCPLCDESLGYTEQFVIGRFPTPDGPTNVGLVHTRCVPDPEATP